MTTVVDALTAALSNALHVPTHRGPYDGEARKRDIIAKNALTDRPRRCACIGCLHGSGHITGAIR